MLIASVPKSERAKKKEKEGTFGNREDTFHMITDDELERLT